MVLKMDLEMFGCCTNNFVSECHFSAQQSNISNILINGDLDIPSGASLVINAGSQIRLSEHSNIIIFGDLKIAGTKDNPVLFKSDSWNHPWGGI